MKGIELKIIFDHKHAYLTEDQFFTLDQLNLPEIAKEFKSEAYWKIKVVNYFEDTKQLFCSILSYHVGKTEFEEIQKLLANELNEVKTIKFKGIDTAGLLKTLNGTGSISVFPVKENIQAQPNLPYQEKNKIEATIKREIKETFTVPFKQLRFRLGGVSFDKKFDGLKHTIELTVSNYEIRDEFDAVKNYFANVLKTKHIKVSAKIELIDGELVKAEALSPEIDKIDQKLIESVRFEFIKQNNKRKINAEIDKSLFTMDEYFDTFSDNKFKSNTFYQNDKELFEDMMAISNTKHYKHLRYLSSKHAYGVMKLRFVLKPFSFIFLIEGERNYHIIWETLNTEEATYIWHTPKDLKQLKMALRKIEDIINVIKIQGKIAYISSSEDNYKRIYHDYSDLVDGFVKWKGELEQILT